MAPVLPVLAERQDEEFAFGAEGAVDTVFGDARALDHLVDRRIEVALLPEHLDGGL